MALAVPVLRVDWSNNGNFTDVIDTVHPLDEPAMSFSRGRSGDFTSDAAGQLVFTLDNTDDAYSFDRNWHDNPSFETDTSGYAVAAVASVTAAGTSITKVADNAPNAGTAAGEAVLTASLNSGVTYAYPINYRFKSGVTYSATVMLKSVSGNLNVQAGLASIGTPADIATSVAGITGAWVKYAVTWTPSADRTDATFFVRTTTAAVATVRIDAVQVNPGATANPYLEAPTKGQLVPGRPVHLYATYSATNYPLFYGFTERIAPDLQNRTVTFTVYDVLRRFGEVSVVVPANTYVARTARDMRIEALADYERGAINLCDNGSVESVITGWGFTAGSTLTRITTDNAPGLGTACAQLVAPSSAHRIEYPLHLAPVFFAGQTYRFSYWAKSTAGGATWYAGAYGGTWTGAGISDQSITFTGTWTRYTFTVALPATYTSTAPLTFFLLSQAAGTVVVDGLMVTRGFADPLYTAAIVGRWPNWVGNGSFDGLALSGWFDGWTNGCTNGSFETNTVGWVGGGIARSTAQFFYGTASATMSALSTTTFNLTGTFKSGQRYDLSMQAFSTVSGLMTFKVASIGTPADTAQGTLNSTSWAPISFAWTPSADRTDAQLSVSSPNTIIFFDGVQIVRRDPTLSAQVYPYADTGPGGGGGSFVTTRTISATAKYGSSSQSMVTPATATAGGVYDFNHFSGYFLSGQAYTASVWINPTSNMPYKLGLSANKGDGTFDEASTTGTATAGVWTQVTLTWTPTATRSASAGLTTLLCVYQTDATARTCLIDGVRVIPGASADAFEMSQWNIPNAADADILISTASLSGTLLSVLQSVNGFVLSRHWITATMATPFYSYNVQDRVTYAAAVSAETFTDGVTTSMAAMAPPEIDRQAIVNAIAITAAGTTEYYQNQTSVETYGYRPGSSINATGIFSSQVIPVLVAAAYLLRYAQPIRRPTFTVVNRFPSQLQRDVNDMVTLTIAPWLIVALFGNIARLTTTIAKTGQEWTSVYQAEEKL